MTTDFIENFCEFGFTTIPRVIGEYEIENLSESLSKLNSSSAVSKNNGATYGVRNLINLDSEVRKLAESYRIRNLAETILGKDAKPVKAIFFDKTPEANWKVPWHQDLTIAVKEKRETENFTAWTRKAEIYHVQPPVSVLEKILAVRIHLDDADETNGALKVVPKSHRKGRLTASEIQDLHNANEIELCRVRRGDAFLMRPLLVHSSSVGTNPKHRRVIHIEFSAEELPNGLEWYGS